MRSPGTGTVGQLPSGRWRVRWVDQDGVRRSAPRLFDTEPEATGYLNAVLAKLAEADLLPVGGLTLKSWGATCLDRWEKLGKRANSTDRNRFKCWIESWEVAARPMAGVERSEVQDRVDDLYACMKHKTYGKGQLLEGAEPISIQSVKHIVTLMRRMFKAAVRAGKIPDHPMKDLELRKDERTHEPWTYLTLAEQLALLQCEKIPAVDRLCIAFTMGTGLRSGEYMNLELADVHAFGEEPHIVVRYGSKKKTTKNGKVRVVPLFGIALAAARAWLAYLPEYAPENPLGLMWPTPRGCRRVKSSRRTAAWHKHLELAGIVAEKRHDGRPVRWHDLRHTCASALVSGMWGKRRWTLYEVKELLGHSSIKVTERYAHLAKGAIAEIAAETGGIAAISGHEQDTVTAKDSLSLISNIAGFLGEVPGERDVDRTRDSRLVSSDDKSIAALSYEARDLLVSRDLADRALAALRAMAEGDPLAINLARSVMVELVEVREAARASELGQQRSEAVG